MTAARNPDLLIDAFLAEGATDLPDRAFDVVRGEIHHTRQRVVVGPWTEPPAKAFAWVAIAAAVALAIGLGWSNLGWVLQPAAQPTVQPSPSPQVLSIPETGPLAPGRYALGGSPDGPTVHVTVGRDWHALDPSWIFLAEGDPHLSRPAFAVRPVANRYRDPCTSDALAEPPAPGVDALISDLASQPGMAAGPIEEITVSGFPGKVVDLRVAAESCLEGYRPWADAGFVQEAGDVSRLYVLDVGGDRFTMFALIPALTTSADLVALEGLLGSIEILP